MNWMEEDEFAGRWVFLRIKEEDFVLSENNTYIQEDRRGILLTSDERHEEDNTVAYIMAY